MHTPHLCRCALAAIVDNRIAIAKGAKDPTSFVVEHILDYLHAPFVQLCLPIRMNWPLIKAGQLFKLWPAARDY